MPLFISFELRAALYCECKRLFEADKADSLWPIAFHRKADSLSAVIRNVCRVSSFWEIVISESGLWLSKIRAIYMRMYGRDVFLEPRKQG